MTRNLGHMDRLIRLVVGVGLVIGGVFNGGLWGWLAAFVGLLLVITGMAGNCCIYSMCGISTYCPPRPGKGS